MARKEAADIEVNHEEPGTALIDVPDDKGQVTSKPFGECSVKQVSQSPAPPPARDHDGQRIRHEDGHVALPAERAVV